MATGPKQKPNCDSGKSSPCGYACIPKDHNCLDTLSGSALGLANVLIDNLSKSAAVKVMQADEVDKIVENADFLANATAAEIIARAFDKGKAELGDDYTDDPAILDAVWQKLDAKTKTKLKTKGKVNRDDHWNPDAEGGNGPPNDARGKYMLELFIKQNGKDAYTGLPIDLLASDLEHIVPYSIGGKQSERPENMVLIARSVNQNRANAPLAEWTARVVANADALKDKATAPPKIDKAALESALELTPTDGWQDEDIDKFGPKFYYVSKRLGLKNTYSYEMASGRSASDRPPASWGKPIVKSMARALRTGNTEGADRVREANDKLLAVMTNKKLGKLSDAEAGLQIRQIMSSVKDV